jgi:hypothetical protein
MLRTTLLALAVAGLAAPALAQATPNPANRAAEFDRADANHDGQLTKAEWVAILPDAVKPRADAVWSRMDPDNTGKISKDAYVNFNGRPGGVGTTGDHAGHSGH